MADSEKIELVDDMNQLEVTFVDIQAHKMIAVHCDGENLCRAGTLTILALKTPHKSYIFDVMKLGKQVFDKGLKSILEDVAVVKLMFDCREDCDALWHLFKVKIINVMDLQLMNVLYGSEPSPGCKLVGLAPCVELYLTTDSLWRQKKGGKTASFKIDRQVWSRRPLSSIKQEYLTLEVQVMFRLFGKFSGRVNGVGQDLVAEASERYGALFRDLPTRTYIRNSRLPSGILDMSPEARAVRYMRQPEVETINVVNTATQLESTIDSLGTCKQIAVRYEGKRTGRNGTVSILALGTPYQICLFDIKKLGREVFEMGLKDILENAAIEKLMFDCREDSDALWHLFKVKVTNVMDLQLLDVAYNRKEQQVKETVPNMRGKIDDSSNLRWRLGNTKIQNFKSCINAHLPNSGVGILLQDVDWLTRPIGVVMKTATREKVQAYFALYQKLKASLNKAVFDMVSEGSERYAALFRDKELRKYDSYELNDMLPMYILEEPPSKMIYECAGCKRSFPCKFPPMDDFNNTGSAMTCPVCQTLRPKGLHAYLSDLRCV